MTLRMVWVRVAHLPPDSATAVALGSSGWTRTDVLLADLWAAMTWKPHPNLPKQTAEVATTPEREARLRAARARARQRQDDIDAGRIE